MSLFSGIGDFFGSSPNSKKPPTEDDKKDEAKGPLPPKFVVKTGNAPKTNEKINKYENLVNQYKTKIEKGLLLSEDEKKN